MTNTPNLYWPVYKNLEKEVLEMSNIIHFDDTQLTVYSGKIADLILRAASEIESIAKDLCRQEGKHEEKHKFDFDCLQGSLADWKLDKKEIILSGTTVYFSVRTLKPFELAERLTVKDGVVEPRDSQRCKWNNAYQNLKHDKIAALKHFATVEHLFDALSALYLLNVYFRNTIFKKNAREPGAPGEDFCNVSTSLFGVYYGYDFDPNSLGTNNHRADFEKVVYLIKYTNEFAHRIRCQGGIKSLSISVGTTPEETMEQFETCYYEGVLNKGQEIYPELKKDDDE